MRVGEWERKKNAWCVESVAVAEIGVQSVGRNVGGNERRMLGDGSGML